MEKTLENSRIEQFSYLAAGTVPVFLHIFFLLFLSLATYLLACPTSEQDLLTRHLQ